MRIVLATLVAAALSAVAAGSPTAVDAGSSRGSASLDEYYLFHAKFRVLYDVEWMTKSGTQGDCTPWRIDRGETKVVIEDAPWVQTVKNRKTGKKRRINRADGIPGSISISSTFLRSGKGMWARGSAVGRATARMNRTWTQQGGESDCQPFRPDPSDCGVRTVQTRTATLLPQMRKGFDTLSRPEGTKPALGFAFSAARPYKTCRTHRAAPDLPANFGFWISKADILELNRAAPGDTKQVHSESNGDCSYDLDPEDESCTFHLELTLDLKPWEPGTPYP